MYELKFKNLESDLNSRLKDYEIFLLKLENQQLSDKSLNPNDNLPDDVSEKEN